MTTQQIAELVGAQMHGDGQLVISGASPVHQARMGDITFIDNIKSLRYFSGSKASAVVVPPSILPHLGEVPEGGPVLMVVEDAMQAFLQIAPHFLTVYTPAAAGISPSAHIDPSAQIDPSCCIEVNASIGEECVMGPRCHIYPGVVIGRGCRIGEDVVLRPNVVLYDGTILGNRVTVHAGCVLGADGFGYRLHEGRHQKIPQLGWVEIENDVEIGAGTTIDRATFGATRIGEGTKIDNQVQIAHNCEIGRHNLIVSQVGIAGSCSTGEYVVLAGQSGLADHVHVGDHTVVGAKSGVMDNTPPRQQLLGAPATTALAHKRQLVCLRKLPDLVRTVSLIKDRLGMSEEPLPHSSSETVLPPRAVG